MQEIKAINTKNYCLWWHWPRSKKDIIKRRIRSLNKRGYNRWGTHQNYVRLWFWAKVISTDIVTKKRFVLMTLQTKVHQFYILPCHYCCCFVSGWKILRFVSIPIYSCKVDWKISRWFWRDSFFPVMVKVLCVCVLWVNCSPQEYWNTMVSFQSQTPAIHLWHQFSFLTLVSVDIKNIDIQHLRFVVFTWKDGWSSNL